MEIFRRTSEIIQVLLQYGKNEDQCAIFDSFSLNPSYNKVWSLYLRNTVRDLISGTLKNRGNVRTGLLISP
jgi:hypothetical protein